VIRSLRLLQIAASGELRRFHGKILFAYLGFNIFQPSTYFMDTKSRRILTGILFCPVTIFCQESINESMMDQIKNEERNDSKLEWIAHYVTDVSGSRLTNSSGYRRACQWAKATLTEWGLANAHLEPWGNFGYGWDLVKSTLSLQKPYYEPIIAYARPWSGSTPGLITAQVLILENQDSVWIAKNAARIHGKIVLLKSQDSVIHGSFVADAHRYSDSALNAMQDTYMINAEQLHYFLPIILKTIRIRGMLKKAGALGILSMPFGNSGNNGTVFVDGFGGFRRGDQPAMPEMVLSAEACYKIERLIRSGHEVTMSMETKTRLLSDDMKGYNVLAEIPGTDPNLKDEVVMLGGHFDSWQSATGATDNGAGCIAMLEAVRILKKLGVRPKRTIRIALWGGEEQGLLGSFHYVKNHFGDPSTMKLSPEQQKISVYFNLDNGSGKIRGVFAQGNDAAMPIFQAWLQPFHEVGATTVSHHNTGATDHLSFDAVGIPGFQFIQDPLDYESRVHHSNMDNYDHLFLDDLKQAATVIAAFVYNAAMRDEKMPRKELPKPEKFIFQEFDEDIP
jgi:hypothetical protein